MQIKSLDELAILKKAVWKSKVVRKGIYGYWIDNDCENEGEGGWIVSGQMVNIEDWHYFEEEENSHD